MDNLRYISLQYIKGDNYEKIQCFKYEEIMELLAYIKMSGDYSPDILKNLKDMKEKDKCPVGESFLNDLVSYYNFKDIRDAIDDIENDAKEDDLAFTNKKEIKDLFNSNEKYDKATLTALFNNIINNKSVNVTEKKSNEAKKDVNVLKKELDEAKKKLDEAKKKLEDAYLKAGISTLTSTKAKYNKKYPFDTRKLNYANELINNIKSLQSDLDKAQSNLDIAELRLDKAVIDAIIEVAGEIDNIKNKTIKDLELKEVNELKKAIRNSKNVYKAIEEIDDRYNKNIPTIKKDNKKDKKDKKDKKKDKKVSVKTSKVILIDGIFDNINNTGDIINYIKNKIGTDLDENKNLITILKDVLDYDSERETVMALLQIYRKICDRNIDKFDNLFTKTDISSIDDAFMIKSYAVFLDKLEKIKKSLEGKDLTKQERGLSNTLERLFDLYGINDPDTLLKGEDTKYLYEHIFQ